MGIELNKNDDPFTTDTLQRTARQVINLCLKGGDLKDFIGYYQRQRLLWLQQYINNIL